jgi:hypothetical protein
MNPPKSTDKPSRVAADEGEVLLDGTLPWRSVRNWPSSAGHCASSAEVRRIRRRNLPATRLSDWLTS